MSSSDSDAKCQEDTDAKNVVLADLTKDVALCKDADAFGKELIRYAVSVVIVVSDGIRISDKPGGVYPGVMIGHTETTARIALSMTQPLRTHDDGRTSTYLYQVCEGGDKEWTKECASLLFQCLAIGNRTAERKRDYVIAVEKAFKALIQREKEAIVVSKSR
jgi:hypothetical protein